MITVLCDLSVLRISGSSDDGVADLVDMMTMAVVTMAVKRGLDREQKVVKQWTDSNGGWNNWIMVTTVSIITMIWTH